MACAYLWREWSRYESNQVFHWLPESGQMPVGWLWMIIVTLALMILNWGIEAQKWRTLIKGVEPMGWWRAFTATLAGCSVSVITPNRTGEFVGRVLFVRPEVRIEAATLTVLGNISQLLTTLLGGSLGLVLLLVFHKPMPMATNWQWLLFFFTALICSAIAAAFFLWPARLRHRG